MRFGMNLMRGCTFIVHRRYSGTEIRQQRCVHVKRLCDTCMKMKEIIKIVTRGGLDRRMFENYVFLFFICI